MKTAHSSPRGKNSHTWDFLCFVLCHLLHLYPLKHISILVYSRLLTWWGCGNKWWLASQTSTGVWKGKEGIQFWKAELLICRGCTNSRKLVSYINCRLPRCFPQSGRTVWYRKTDKQYHFWSSLNTAMSIKKKMFNCCYLKLNSHHAMSCYILN